MADKADDGCFQISVKGLFLSENKVMMLLQDDGNWEPPGGRVQSNEDLFECLKRECLEETGITCEISDERPLVVYKTSDQHEKERLMIYYKVHLETLDFKPSEECVDIKFFAKEELVGLPMVSQVKPLVRFL